MVQESSDKKNNSAAQNAKGARSIWPKLFTLAVLVGVAGIFIALLPRGFSQDFSLIGKGSNIVVLVHDLNSVASANNMDIVSGTLREEYDNRVTFLVADGHSPQGKAFLENYNIEERTTAVIFFAPDGTALSIAYGELDVATMRKKINQAFRF